MKHLLAAAALAFAGMAHAQFTPQMPPVWPAQAGSVGSSFKTGTTATGQWAAWTHTVNGVTTIYPICVLNDYRLIHPVITLRMTTIQTMRAYWAANVTTVCSRDPRMAEIYRAMVDEMWK